MPDPEGTRVKLIPSRIIEHGETAEFASPVEIARINGAADWRLCLLALTDKRLIVTKDSMFRPKADFSTPWSEVFDITGENVEMTLSGSNIKFLVATGPGPITLIVQNQYAAEVEAAIRARYLRARETS